VHEKGLCSHAIKVSHSSRYDFAYALTIAPSVNKYKLLLHINLSDRYYLSINENPNNGTNYVQEINICTRKGAIFAKKLTNYATIRQFWCSFWSSLGSGRLQRVGSVSICMVGEWGLSIMPGLV